MACNQPAAVAELYWWTVPASDRERASRDHGLSIDYVDAIVHPADRPRSRLAA